MISLGLNFHSPMIFDMILKGITHSAFTNISPSYCKKFRTVLGNKKKKEKEKLFADRDLPSLHGRS